MPDQIPPPGPDRDAELAEALGWEPCSCAPGSTRYDGDTGRCRRCGCLAAPPYSTDPAACDRLVEEMVWRGLSVFHDASPAGHMVDVYRGFASSQCLAEDVSGRGRCDAVSAAALLALRSAS